MPTIKPIQLSGFIIRSKLSAKEEVCLRSSGPNDSYCYFQDRCIEAYNKFFGEHDSGKHAGYAVELYYYDGTSCSFDPNTGISNVWLNREDHYALLDFC